MTCANCGAELKRAPGPAGDRDGAGRFACPYDSLAYPDLRAGHDRIYFGRWRAIEASALDIRRAYHRLGRHLAAVERALEGKDLPAARRDLAKAVEAYQAGDPRDEGPDTLRFIDHALSYAHRVIDDLLHEDGLPSHNPMDFAEWYDAVDVPFREEW